MFRDVVQVEGLDVRQRAALPRGRASRRSGPRARVDHDDLATQGASPAVRQGHLDRLRRDEAAVPHDEFRPARPVLVEVHRDQPVDHLPLAVAHAGHVDLPVALGDPELGAPSGNTRRPSRCG